MKVSKALSVCFAVSIALVVLWSCATAPVATVATTPSRIFVVDEPGALNVPEFLKPGWESVNVTSEPAYNTQWFFLECATPGPDGVKYAVIILIENLPWPWAYAYLQDGRLNVFEANGESPTYKRAVLTEEWCNFLTDLFFTYLGVSIDSVRGC